MSWTRLGCTPGCGGDLVGSYFAFRFLLFFLSPFSFFLLVFILLFRGVPLLPTRALNLLCAVFALFTCSCSLFLFCVLIAGPVASPQKGVCAVLHVWACIAPQELNLWACVLGVSILPRLARQSSTML